MLEIKSRSPPSHPILSDSEIVVTVIIICDDKMDEEQKGENGDDYI